MLPDLQILRRDPLWTAGGYSFDPFCFLTRSPGAGPASRDDAAEILAAFAAHQAAFHEDHHWLQWIGTSVGLFLTLVRFSQEQTAVLLAELPRALRERLLFEHRRRGIPLVKLDNSGVLTPDTDRGDRQLGSLIQGWYDHLLTYGLFFDSPGVDAMAWDRSAGLTETICDLSEVLHRRGAASDYDYRTVQNRARALRGLERRVAFDSTRLTTRLIMESAATVDELLTAAALTRLVKDTRTLGDDIVHRLRHGAYGLPLRLFGSIVHGHPDRAFEDLLTFGLVCDIALNPPLPPSVPGDRIPLEWDELYPPLRFARACEAVGRIGCRLDGTSTKDDYVDVQEAVYAAARLAAPALSDPLDARPEGRWRHWIAAPPRDSADRAPPDEVPNHLSYFDFILWCGDNARRLRRENLPLLLNPGWRTTIGDDVAVELRVLKSGDGWLRSPIVERDGTLLFAEPLKPSFGTWFAMSAAVATCIQDWMAGTGEPDVSLIPRRIQQEYESDIARGVEGLLDL